MVKVTFTLDEDTVAALRRSSERRHKAQSQVVREAIAEYAARDDKLSDSERDDWLRALDEYRRAAPRRPRPQVQAEIREIRDARKTGGRRHSGR